MQKTTAGGFGGIVAYAIYAFLASQGWVNFIPFVDEIIKALFIGGSSLFFYSAEPAEPIVQLKRQISGDDE